MKVTDYHEVKLEDVEMEGAKNVKIRWLISDKDNAKNFAMRLFEIGPEGHTPYHGHDWEHEVFVLEGEGEAKIDGKIYPIKKDSVIFVEPGQEHNFANSGSSSMKFLCLIPYK
ncbi:MAG: cupin domain-containing protein [Atribacterota bacterium]|jgi:quercetin dioxygenase-like cupin family protein|nr:cupin domain-containing protein [Atribacterota bacterium]